MATCRAQAPTALGYPPETELGGEALVAADGTWLVWAESGYGSPDLHPAVATLLAKAWVLRQLPQLFETWDRFHTATDPIDRADALQQLADTMARLHADFTADGEPDAGQR